MYSTSVSMILCSRLQNNSDIKKATTRVCLSHSVHHRMSQRVREQALSPLLGRGPVFVHNFASAGTQLFIHHVLLEEWMHTVPEELRIQLPDLALDLDRAALIQVLSCGQSLQVLRWNVRMALQDGHWDGLQLWQRDVWKSFVQQLVQA